MLLAHDISLSPCSTTSRLRQPHRRGLSVRPRFANRCQAASVFGWPLGSTSKERTRLQTIAKQLKQALLESSNKIASSEVDTLVDELAASTQAFRSQDIGEGPWQVMYTRGPLLWQFLTAPGTIANPSNEFSQQFNCSTGTLINKGELLGQKLFVTAEGTYTVQGQDSRFPVRIVADVQRGSLHVGIGGGIQIPLPIKGRGEVDLVYADADQRIFRQPSGSMTVQVRRSLLQPQQ